MSKVTIYTDGGCSPNPGPGGWGAVICHSDGSVQELSGAQERTTNNQMEITAAIEALRALHDPARIEIITDSKYVQKGITLWLKGWRKKGWITKSGQPVKNQELWQTLDGEIRRHVVTWSWTRGHSGNAGNERADALARAEIPRAPLPTEETDAVHLFCAASFAGKSKLGGYGVILRYQENRKQLSGRSENSSANQMHLLAAIHALEALKRRSKVHLYTTSSYVRDGATRWIPGWRRRDWTTAAGKEVSHRQLWERIDHAQQQHLVSWHVVDRNNGAPAELLDAKRLSADAQQSTSHVADQASS